MSARIIVMNITKKHEVRILVYNEEGMKVNEIHVDSNSIELDGPEHVVITRYMVDDGVLVIARNPRSIKAGKSVLG